MAKNKFSYEVQKGQQIFDDPVARQVWMGNKPDNYRGIESHGKPVQSKTNPQLGYYWGLLIPEITKQLIKDGWTIAMNFGGHTRERLYTNDDTHLLMKSHCAKIGDSGGFITLSEQDKELCRKYIDNVLWVAEFWLKMDKEKLEAKRPKDKLWRKK